MSDTLGRWSGTDSQGKWVFTLTFTKVPKNLRLKLQRSWESRDLPFLIFIGSDCVITWCLNGPQGITDMFHSGEKQLNIIRKSSLFDHMLNPLWFQEGSRVIPVQLVWHQVTARVGAWLEDRMSVVQRQIWLPWTYCLKNWHSCYFIMCFLWKVFCVAVFAAAAAAAKLLQSCPTLCDPRESSPPGSPIPGILQARTLEWVAITFSNAWKWELKGKSLSGVQL